MKKQHQAIIALIVISIGILMYFVFRRDPNSITVTVHTYQEKSSLYDISIEYPEFSRVSGAFNAEIRKTTDAALVIFKKAAEETESVRGTSSGKGMPRYQYSFMVRWIPEELSPRMVSVVLRTSYFTGGAHGGQSIYTFTYDPVKKTAVSLDDVFVAAPNYLSRISEFVLNDLKDQLKSASGGHEPDMTMLKEGTTPTVDNFSRFTLGPNNTITFYFPQ